MKRMQFTLLALVFVQSAHSIEEYVGRLWENFPPAAWLTGLVSTNHETGFIVINVAFVLFGLWCAVPVRREWRSARGLMWFWALIEASNGIGHMGWSLIQRSYSPGVITAPVMLVVALALVSQLRRSGRGHPTPA